MVTLQAEQAEQHAEILEEQSLALRESEERFRSAFDFAPIGIALVSPAGKWLKVNHALCEILGYTEEELLKTDFQSILFSEDLGNTLTKIHELLSGKILILPDGTALSAQKPANRLGFVERFCRH